MALNEHGMCSKWLVSPLFECAWSVLGMCLVCAWYVHGRCLRRPGLSPASKLPDCK